MFFRCNLDVMAPILQCFSQCKQGNHVAKPAFTNQKDMGHERKWGLWKFDRAKTRMLAVGARTAVGPT